MQINYCDLCATPLKENNFYILYTITPGHTNYNELEEVKEHIRTIQNNAKEICPACKHIFDKMFDLRLQRLSELTEEINCIYKLNSKDKKNGKKEK